VTRLESIVCGISAGLVLGAAVAYWMHTAPVEQPPAVVAPAPEVEPIDPIPWSVYQGEVLSDRVEPPVEVKRWAPRKTVRHQHATVTVAPNGSPIIE
jgi:hypothetical protein